MCQPSGADMAIALPELRANGDTYIFIKQVITVKCDKFFGRINLGFCQNTRGAPNLV